MARHKHEPIARAIELRNPTTQAKEYFPKGERNMPDWAFEQVKGNPILWPPEKTETPAQRRRRERMERRREERDDDSGDEGAVDDPDAPAEDPEPEALDIDGDDPSYSLTKPLDQHTGEELRAVCDDLGISHSGNKPELITRIATFLNIPEE